VSLRKRLLKATGPGERTGDSSIQVNGVSKHFNLRTEGASSLKERLTSGRRAKNEEFRALSDVTFDVPAGSMWALVGHNGSGKSTLLRCIAGIYQTTAGTIDVSGRMSALLELGSGFHPDLTGRENVYLNAAILGLTRAEVDARMDRIVDFAEIGEFIAPAAHAGPHAHTEVAPGGGIEGAPQMADRLGEIPRQRKGADQADDQRAEHRHHRRPRVMRAPGRDWQMLGAARPHRERRRFGTRRFDLLALEPEISADADDARHLY